MERARLPVATMAVLACGIAAASPGRSRAEEWEVGGPLAGLKLPSSRRCTASLRASRGASRGSPRRVEPRVHIPGAGSPGRAGPGIGRELPRLHVQVHADPLLLRPPEPGARLDRPDIPGASRSEEHAAAPLLVPATIPARDGPAGEARRGRAARGGESRPRLDLASWRSGSTRCASSARSRPPPSAPSGGPSSSRRASTTARRQVTAHRLRLGYCDEFYGVARSTSTRPRSAATGPRSRSGRGARWTSSSGRSPSTTSWRRRAPGGEDAADPWPPACALRALRLSKDDRWARDAAIWEAFPPLNRQGSLFSMAGGDEHVLRPSVTSGTEGPPGRRSRSAGAAGRPGDFADPAAGASSSRTEPRPPLRPRGPPRRPPPPAPYPYPDDGTGLAFPLRTIPARGASGAPSPRRSRTGSATSTTSPTARASVPREGGSRRRPGCRGGPRRWAYDFPAIDTANFLVSVRPRSRAVRPRLPLPPPRDGRLLPPPLHAVRRSPPPRLRPALRGDAGRRGPGGLDRTVRPLGRDARRRDPPRGRLPPPDRREADPPLPLPHRPHGHREPRRRRRRSLPDRPLDGVALLEDLRLPPRPSGVLDCMVTGCDRTAASTSGRPTTPRGKGRPAWPLPSSGTSRRGATGGSTWPTPASRRSRRPTSAGASRTSWPAATSSGSAM